MRIKSLPIICFICLILIIAAFKSSQATTVIKMELEQMAQNADIILSGSVINIENRVVKIEENEVPFTFVTLSIREVIKGNVTGDTYTLQLPGGRNPKTGQSMGVVGMPTFQLGEEVILFIREGISVTSSPIVGFYQGRYNLKTDEKTGHKFVVNHWGKPVEEKSILGTSSTQPEKPVNYEVFRTYLKKFTN